MSRLIRWKSVRFPAYLVASTFFFSLCLVSVWIFNDGQRKQASVLAKQHRKFHDRHLMLWRSRLESVKQDLAPSGTRIDKLKQDFQDLDSQKANSPFQQDARSNIDHGSSSLVELIDLAGKKIYQASLHQEVALYHLDVFIFYENIARGWASGSISLPTDLEIRRRLIGQRLTHRPKVRPDQEDEWADVIRHFDVSSGP